MTARTLRTLATAAAIWASIGAHGLALLAASTLAAWPPSAPEPTMVPIEVVWLEAPAPPPEPPKPPKVVHREPVAPPRLVTAEPGSLEQTLDGKQRSRGFEIEAIGRILPNWNLFGGYTYLDARVLESKDVQGGVPVQGKRLIAAPEHSVSLWTTYDLTRQWQVGGGMVYVGERASNTGNTNKLPGYAKGDLTVAYFPWRNVELRMNVLNVSNERYFDSVYRAHTPPAPGRTALFTGNFRF